MGDLVRATGYAADFDALGYSYNDLTRVFLDTRLIIEDARYLTHDRSRYEARGNPIDYAIAASRCPDCNYNIVADPKSERQKGRHPGRNTTVERPSAGPCGTVRIQETGTSWSSMPRAVHVGRATKIRSPIVNLPTGPQSVSHLSAEPGMFDGLARNWEDPIDHVH
jgi:hypothetical protein